ncbi:hypothetical protein E0Z10_g7149 [Xylaria hypoxylon]|uniref:C2H2-type domain-containing protein n=1 Tax=Xylaria hypoxylon TaxID=37992 RepID=A0A4Z0YCD9_9PEZI|nr:hypothetical protein E0Z10_g7149 [Xylaria hypoxylon]
MASIMRTPLPQKRPAPVDNDEDQREVDLTARLVNKRTPLPTLLQRTPAGLDNEAKRLAAARRRATRSKNLLASVENDTDQIDLNQAPSMQGVDGVVCLLTNSTTTVKSGKYRCNVCGSQMKNEKVLIKCHNSKLHPKDPIKGSAYLRQQARKPTPCPTCDKICSSIEMVKKHIKQVHSQAEPSTASVSPEQDLVG